jgi:hypothetical protein
MVKKRIRPREKRFPNTCALVDSLLPWVDHCLVGLVGWMGVVGWSRWDDTTTLFVFSSRRTGSNTLRTPKCSQSPKKVKKWPPRQIYVVLHFPSSWPQLHEPVAKSIQTKVSLVWPVAFVHLQIASTSIDCLGTQSDGDLKRTYTSSTQFSGFQ